MAMFDMKEEYRFRISKHCCYMNGIMMENSQPIVLAENIPTPDKCIRKIREMMSEPCTDHQSCIGDDSQQSCLPNQNLLFSLPTKLNEKTFIMLRGEHCACKLFIEMYECLEEVYPWMKMQFHLPK